MKKNPALSVFASAVLTGCLLAGPAGSANAFNASSSSADFHQIGTAGFHTKVKEGAVLGKLYVPRFGKNYLRTILQGTKTATLNNKAGLGHYDQTQMVGQVGNFAIAGHRFANGGPMLKIDKLKVGDLAFVKTATYWYTYKYLASKTVKPSNVGVIYPVPKGLAGAVEGGRYMTFTSCTPVHVNTHRIAAWFELVSETPTSAGMPAELAAVLN